MKIFQYFFISLVFILVFAILAIAQTEKTQPYTPYTSNRHCLICLYAIGNEKSGIRELVTDYQKLEIEFKQLDDEFTFLTENYSKSAKELKYLASLDRANASKF